MFASIRNRLEDSTYAKGFVVLLSAAGFAQALPILIMPILTRLYTPEEFAVFGFMVGLLYAFGPSVSLRIDAVQMVAPDEHTARTLFASGLVNATVVTALVIAGALIFDIFKPVEALHRFPYWLLAMVALAVLSEAFGQSFLEHLTRHKKFVPMSKARVLRTAVLVLVQLLGGLLSMGYTGLVLGVLLSCISVPLYLTLKTDILLPAIRQLNWRRYVGAHVEYRDYVIYGGVTNVLNTIMLAIPVLFFTTVYPEAIAGQIVLAMRAIDAGLQAIREATARIHARRVLQAVRENDRPVVRVLQVSGMLLAFGVLIAIVIIVGGEFLFKLVFGGEWEKAGQFAGTLVPALVLHFVVSAVSGTMGATRRLGLLALWRIVAFILTLVFFLNLDASVPVETAVRNYAILTAFLYLLYFAAIIYAASNPHPSLVGTNEPEES